MLVKTKSLDQKTSRSTKSAIPNPFQSAFASSRVGMLLVDASRPGFPVVVANKAFLRLSGRLGTRVAGRPFLNLLGLVPDDVMVIERMLGTSTGERLTSPSAVRQASRSGAV